MTWRRYLAFFMVIVGLRALGEHFGQRWDAYLLAFVVVTLLAGGFYNRSRWHGTLKRLGYGSDTERAKILQDLADKDLAVSWYAAHETGIEPLPVAPQEGTFSYPPGSRSLLTFQFWACVLFAGGFLRPIITEGSTDPANDWVLFVLGLVFLGGAAMAIARSRRVGRSVTIDAHGVRETLRDHVTGEITWEKLGLIRRRRAGGLEFRSLDGRRLIIYPQLRGYGNFVMLLRAFLQAGAPDAG